MGDYVKSQNTCLFISHNAASLEYNQNEFFQTPADAHFDAPVIIARNFGL